MSDRIAPFRPATPDDAPQICAIYNHYVVSTVVTFEEEPVAAADMAARISRVSETFPWLVAERDGSIEGYAYASQWHTRCAYRLSVESTIYLRPDCGGRGLGSALYRALIDELRSRGLHCVIGGIALPNPASVRLHEKLGFEKVAHFREVGFKLGRWIDVGYWKLILGRDA
ncbi:MAG TPA: arsinothricin resistance N-acetyltransferase ArsN1 family B [Gammaproteobacteria bacterium]